MVAPGFLAGVLPQSACPVAAQSGVDAMSLSPEWPPTLIVEGHFPLKSFHQVRASDSVAASEQAFDPTVVVKLPAPCVGDRTVDLRRVCAVTVGTA